MFKTKMLGIIGILLGLMLMGSMLAGPAFAGGQNGKGNGNSQDGAENTFAVCHNGDTLWLDAEGFADHTSTDPEVGHGDPIGVCV